MIDLRFNEGGNFFVAKSHFEGLRTHPINRRGGIFVLISGKTFSAAIVNAVHLHDSTEAIFIGEEVGDPLDFYFNTESFVLPRSGITVQYGEGRQLFPDRLKMRFLPDLPAPMSSADYLAGRDPAFEAALAWPVIADLRPRPYATSAPSARAEQREASRRP